MSQNHSGSHGKDANRGHGASFNGKAHAPSKGKKRKPAFDEIDGGWMKKKMSDSKTDTQGQSPRRKAGKPADQGKKGKQHGKGGKPPKAAHDSRSSKTPKRAARIETPEISAAYDFNDEPNRRNTNSLKWEVGADELPMWVADMDIKAAPAITQALVNRAASGVFGYASIPAEYRQTVCDWWKRRHHIELDQQDILFCNGVMPAISSIIRTFTNPEDSVLVQPPVYNHFFSVISDNGRTVVESPLDYDGKYYFINWEDLEEKLAAPEVTMMLLCNPQNPVGKLWSAEDLERIGELCSMHGVIVVSDEIHCDIVKPGEHHIPFASVSEECRQLSITCGSTSKAFNTAGIQSAYVICPNEQLREGVKEGMQIDQVSFPNAFAIDTTLAAYTECDQWLDDLCAHIQSNKEEAAHYIEQRLPEVVVVPSDSTYLLWLDCMELSSDASELCDAIREETGLVLCPGSIYGSTAEPFLRMNVACSKRQLQDALRRLDSFFNMYE